MHTYNSDIPCPECGRKEMVVHTYKALAESVVNIFASMEEAARFMKNDTDGIDNASIRDSVQAMECKNCGNKENKLDLTVFERGYEKREEKNLNS